MFLTLRYFVRPPGGGILLLAAACFGAGVTAGASIQPVGAGREAEAPPAPIQREALALRGGHPADVVRVLDGDTFEARVKIWPGMEVATTSEPRRSRRAMR